jgi:transcriptional regulator with XRE-family HTH domain
MTDVDAASIVRRARTRAGLSLRALAARAGTSHSALAAYESGRTVPTVDTLGRVVRAAGFQMTAELEPRVDASAQLDRGEELEQVLGLAEMFPARHSPVLAYPPFGR